MPAGDATGTVVAAAGDGGAGIVWNTGSVRGGRLVAAAGVTAALVAVAVDKFGMTTGAGRFDAGVEVAGRVGAAMVVVAGAGEAGATGAAGGVLETASAGVGLAAALVRPSSA